MTIRGLGVRSLVWHEILDAWKSTREAGNFPTIVNSQNDHDENDTGDIQGDGQGFWPPRVGDGVVQVMESGGTCRNRDVKKNSSSDNFSGGSSLVCVGLLERVV